MVEIPLHRFHADVPNQLWVDGGDLTYYHQGWQQGFYVASYEGILYPAVYIRTDVLPGGSALRYQWMSNTITIWM